jgi:hypothetical protein
MQIPKEQVAVAYKGLQPKFLYIGTKNMPPPKPNPLKIPAKILFINIYFICDLKLAYIYSSL